MADAVIIATQVSRGVGGGRGGGETSASALTPRAPCCSNAAKRTVTSCALLPGFPKAPRPPAPQDTMHVAPAMAFADLGYHILLEKPMAVSTHDCQRIADAAKRNNVLLAVCHVLRYTPYMRKMIELIRSGAIGEVVNVSHLEPIGSWHFAHSYVRGAW